MNLTSEWQITYDPTGTPLVIVAYGQAISEELHYQLRLGFSAEPIIDADPFLWGDGSAVYNFNVTVFGTSALDIDAREALMDSMLGIVGRSRKPLYIRVRGLAAARGKSDIYWKFLNARISTFSPYREIDYPDPAAATTYSITATGLSKIIVP